MGAGYSIKARANNAADIYLYEQVGEDWFGGGGVTAKQFKDDLAALGKVTAIDLHINSPGGDVFQGQTIYKLLNDHPAKITAHIDGLAASIASVIAMAADEIRMAESGFFMIHDAMGMGIGRADEMRKAADLLDKVTGAIRDVYIARTGQPEAKIRDWMTEETWFTAEEAVKAGFVSKVVENKRVSAKVDPIRYQFKHAPAALTASVPKQNIKSSTATQTPRLAAAAARLAHQRTGLAVQATRLQAAQRG